MRFDLPPKTTRAEIVAALHDYYDEQDIDDFRFAWAMLGEFYRVKAPKVKWRRQIDRGWTMGLTHPSDNIVELIHPTWFAKRAAPENTADMWVRVVLHEWSHVLTAVDDERKADQYAAAMVAGMLP